MKIEKLVTHMYGEAKGNNVPRERGNLCNLNSMLKIITTICTHVLRCFSVEELSAGYVIASELSRK